MALVLMAEFEIKPGRGEDFAEYIQWHATQSLTEPGCRFFRANRDQADPLRFVMYEIYDDEAAVAAHRETPHYARFLNEIVPNLIVMRGESPVVWRRLLDSVNLDPPA